MAFVYSTATAPIKYTGFKDTSNDLKEITYEITIKGGHGLVDKNFITPQGVMTIVTAEEAEILLKDDHFKMHVERGFMRLEKTKADTEKVSSDMEQRDKSAPLVPQDFVDGKAPTTQVI